MDSVVHVQHRFSTLLGIHVSITSFLALNICGRNASTRMPTGNEPFHGPGGASSGGRIVGARHGRHNDSGQIDEKCSFKDTLNQK